MSLQTQSAPLTPAPQGPGRPNEVLSRLPKDAEQRLLVHCTRVPLPRHELLLEAGNTAKWAYFPCSGLVSLQMMTEDGRAQRRFHDSITPLKTCSAAIRLAIDITALLGSP
jgi:CRP-like cAMP-binding protein